MSHDDMRHDGKNLDNQRPAETLPDALRWSLRGLRREVVPQQDLWSGIAARIADAPGSATRTAGRRRHYNWSGAAPLALAASIVFAIGVAWQLRPLSVETTTTRASSLVQEAAAMTREYDAAMIELSAGNNTDLPVLRVLDRSAAAIRTAMTRDPDARFLLDRLRHTYEHRLALTQRIAMI